MKNDGIVFTRPGVAELIERDSGAAEGDLVLVRTLFSTVSPGTEKANITGNPNVSGASAPSVRFPRSAGYSSCGIVEETGPDVKSVKPGDYVVMYRSKHLRYNLLHEKNVIKFDPERLSPEEAATLYITVFPLAAIRKTRLEIGESALVMGCGLLGQLAVRQLRAAGAVPIIAADLIESRRKQALEGGADYALDPAEEGFADKVKELTGGGANVCIEVTGVGAGLDGALDCMKPFGRVALLGCTRDKEFSIDYYRKVHFPGITLVGAHTNARPDHESHPGYFTDRDDICSMIKLIESGRIDLKPMLGEVYSPSECGAVYERLINDKSFPTVVQFDWRK